MPRNWCAGRRIVILYFSESVASTLIGALVAAAAPGKLTLRDTWLIDKLLLGRWSIAYLTRGTKRSYGPAHWLDYYETHAIMCAWYYTSCCIQQTWNQTAKYTSFHAPKYALKTLSITLPSMLSITLPSMLSSSLPIALDGTLSACWTVRSQVSSQDALKHTPEHALKFTPNCTQWHTPGLLDCTLPSKLSRRSQAHSRACSEVHSQLHSMGHSQPAGLYAPK